MKQVLAILLLSFLLASCSTESPLLITLIGTNDVHGQLLRKDDLGGLQLFSAYVDATRKARENDGGAVLLIDAGDMWQGTLESNLSEGASVVAAFNALGYTAAAVGNHEFDFGPVGPAPIPETETDDARGALKQRALEAEFPFLAANLIDDATGLPVDWKNVSPSTLVNVQGVTIGIIGVLAKGEIHVFQRCLRHFEIHEFRACRFRFRGTVTRPDRSIRSCRIHGRATDERNRYS